MQVWLGTKSYTATSPNDLPSSDTIARFDKGLFYVDVFNKQRFLWSFPVFYSDSINDAPLLKQVGHPRVVTPDQRLDQLAQENEWPVVDFK